MASLKILCVPMLLCASMASKAITVGQIDTFQDGTTQFWEGAQPENVPTGGPSGVDDKFLKITSIGGSGPNSHLATKNTGIWSGDWKAAGATGIRLNVFNFGTTTLELRAVLFDFNNTKWTSTLAQFVNPGTGWQQRTFTITQAAMTRVGGTESFDFTSQNVIQLMIRHDAGGPSSGGTPIASSLGMDNILATPEPSSILAMVLGGAAVAVLRRRSRIR